jgi:hypothetical protein
MRARLTGVVAALNEGFLPCFVERASGVLDPGAAGDAGGITWIEVAGDAAQLESWLACADLPVRVVGGPPGVRAVGIGDRQLRPR